MSDVYESEINPDDEPGERLQEGLRAADANDHDADGQIYRDFANDLRTKERRQNDRRTRAANQ
jgi:hypothetical protein